MTELQIAQLTVAVSTIPIAVALFRWKFINSPLRIFFIYKVLSLLVNLFEQFFIWYATNYFNAVEPYLTYWGIQDTSFIGILFHVIAFIYLGKFYSILLGAKNHGKTLLWIAYILCAVAIVNYVFIEGYKIYGKFNPAASAIFIFSAAVFYLYHLFRSNLTLPIRKNPYFWLSLGVITPNLLGVFLFIVGDVVHKQDYQLFTALSSFKNGFLIIGQILMAIGFYQAPFARFITLPDEKNT